MIYYGSLKMCDANIYGSNEKITLHFIINILQLTLNDLNS